MLQHAESSKCTFCTMWELFQFVGIFLKRTFSSPTTTCYNHENRVPKDYYSNSKCNMKKRLLRMINCVGNGFTDTAIIRKNPIIQTPHQGTNQLYYELRRGGHI